MPPARRPRRAARVREALAATWSDPPGFIGALLGDQPQDHRPPLHGDDVRLLHPRRPARARDAHAARAPRRRLVGPDMYNELFTMHGTTMMFLFAVPVMQAVAGYLIPLMIGARSVAFPRMNAYAYWVFLFGGILLFASLAVNTAPAAGWFSYVPLAGPDYAPGKGTDIWAQMITFTELSGLLEAVVLITTIFKLRAPGMSLNRMPLFVWATLVTQFMVIFAMPSVMLCSTALILDRLVGTQFYNPAHGGDVLLWQHLFWFFGHPEVYLIFIPPLGFISSIIPTFARRPVFGYPAMVLSLIATAFLAFGLWVHHMFATNVPELGKSFFTAASLMIAIPSALQIFCWIGTLWTGRLDLKTPLYFVLAFFFILVLGGLTGLMLALRAARSAGPRHLFRRRASALRADRRRGVSALRRVLLLVSQVHRPHARRDARALEFLAVLHRLQRHLLSDASARPARHAAPRVDLSARHGLGRHEPRGDDRRVDHRARACCCSSSMW